MVFLSYQRESPSSDFRLKSCDGKSVFSPFAQDIGIGSELVDDVDCHPLLGFAKKDSKKHRAKIVSRAFPKRTEAASSSHGFAVEVVVQCITAQKSELLEAPS